MTPSSARYKSLRHRQASLEPPNPPNDTPSFIPVIVPPTGGDSAGTEASIIVPLTVIPGVLLIGVGLWLIYWLYMRNQDHPVHRGGLDRERHSGTTHSPRTNTHFPERGHQMVTRGGNRHVSRSGRNDDRGEITRPHHLTSEITSSTESVCGTDIGHPQDIVTRPRRAARRGTPKPPLRPALREPAPPSPPPSPPPVIQKRRNTGDNYFRDDRNGRGSTETLRHSRSRSRSSAVPQNRRNIGASNRDDRRGRNAIRDLRPSRSRSRSRVRTELSHGKS